MVMIVEKALGTLPLELSLLLFEPSIFSMFRSKSSQYSRRINCIDCIYSSQKFRQDCLKVQLLDLLPPAERGRNCNV